MNFRTTLILFVLVVAGLIFFIVANRSGTSEDTPSREPASANPSDGRKLLDVKSDDVQKLVIRPTEGQPLELVRAEPEKAAPPAFGASAAEWKIVQPVAWAADSFDARNLIESVVNMRSRGRVEAKADRAGFGLGDKPRYTVELTDKSGKTTKLLVGNQMALGNDLYVDAGDGKGVSMASAGTLADKLEKGTQKLYEELRDKRLVTASTADVKQVQVTPRKGPKLVLHKDGADWKVVEPKQVAADAGEVSSLLSAVTGLRAEEFVKPDAPEAAGAMIDQPRLVVSFSKEAPSTQPATGPAQTKPSTGPASRPGGTTTVAFGQFANIERDKMYVKVSPEPDVMARVAMTEQSWEKIATASPLTLRDRKVLDLDPERVERVTLSIDKQATTQPTAKPAEKREVVLERRREVLEQGPPAPASSPKPAAPKPGANPASSDAGYQIHPRGAVMLASLEQPADAPAPAATATAPESKPAQVKPADAKAPTAKPVESKPADTSKPAGTSKPADTSKPGDTKASAASSKPTTTQAASRPTTTTAPATAPAPSTGPAEPLSKWVVASGPTKGDADDAKVDALLGGLHPLRANKYLESKPTTPATATYVLKLHTNAYGDQPAKDHELRIVETGSGTDAKVIGQYQDLTFELDRFFLDRLTADFAKKKDAEATQPVAKAE